MLELMRAHSKNWLIKIILGLVALAMVGFFGLSGVDYFTRSNNLAAQVNGEDISMREYDKLLAQMTEQYQQQFGDKFDQIKPMLNLKRMALEQAIQQALMRQAAARLGAAVSDQELAASIASTQAFQVNGQFNMRRYTAVLAANHLTKEAYETYLRQQILSQRLGAMVAGAASVTPLMLKAQAVEDLTKVKGAFLSFDAKAFLPKMKAEETDIQAFYKSHQALYQVPEMITARFIVFPADKYRDQVKVSDRDVGIYYDIHRDKYFEPAKVRASHILLKLAPDADTKKVEEVKAKAEKLMAEAKKDTAKFAELAKKNSEGPTAPRGGDLGYFSQTDMQKSFADAAFSLKPGQVGITRTSFGYHVILVVDAKPGVATPLAKVKDEITAALTARGAQERAEAAAETAYRGLQNGGDLAKAAKAVGLEIKETKPFASGTSPAELPGANKLFESFSGLPANSRIPPVAVEKGAALCVLAQRLPAHVKPLAEVKDKVKKAVLEQKADEAAKAAAQAVLTKLAKDKEPAKALAAMDKAKTTDWLKNDGEIEGLVSSRPVIDALFSLPTAAPVASAPVAVGDAWLAVVLAGRQEPGKENLAKEEKELFQKLLASQQDQVRSAFLADLRESAEISVNKLFEAK